MAASTIDPAIGASTCALGSHRCTVNIGSFTKNPDTINKLKMFDWYFNVIEFIDKDDEADWSKIRQNIKSMGREARIV